MATLPTGWEWDYDGNRWLYRYTPTGHVQYHFPKAGDEFPDFIDASSPAPDLAPEERLESQQQVKRHTSVSGGPSRATRAPAEDKDGWRSRMSATAQPISAVWEDHFGAEDENEEEAEGEAVFQPENFMFLGPGTYVDVSPLVEEEEEAARRAVVGAELRAGLPMDNNRGVSPMVSQNTTPLVRMSETVTRAENEARNHESTTAVNERAIGLPPPPIIPHEEPPMMASMGGYIMGDDIVGEASAIPDGGLDYQMYELPVETAVPVHLHFDPVGVVAEMATEYTAAARAETHPEPVELAGNYIMAPIETEPRPGFVELPAEVNPVEDSTVREERLTDSQLLEQRRQEVRRHQEERQRGVQQRQEERKKREEEELQMELRQQQQQQQQQQNEAYSPSQEQINDIPNQFKIARKPTLRESSNTYSAYASRSQGQEDYQAYAPGQALQNSAQPANSLPARIMSPALQREASLNMSMRPSTLSTPPVDSGPGVVKYPSVLRPARGKPGQSPERRDTSKGLEQGSLANSSTETTGKDARSSGYRLIAHGQHPPSMTPAPVAVQHHPPEQQPPAPTQQPSGIATTQPPAPIQRPYTTAPDLPQSNVQMAHQYTAPSVPPKVSTQLPYPTGSIRMPQPPLARTSTAPYPHDDGPPVAAPYGPLQGKQPLRPASAMPVLQHQRRESASGQAQQLPIRTGPLNPGAVIVPAGMVPRSTTAGPAQQLQQQRRQSYQPGGDPRQNIVPAQNPQPPRPQSVANNPGVYANFASHQTPPPQARSIQRRPTQEDVSPIRSRSQSLSSGALPLETPSPIDSRRGSGNSVGPQNVNNSYFASIPSSQNSSSLPPSNVPLARPPTQESPQSPGAQDRAKRNSMPPQQLVNVIQGNMQGMTSPQPYAQIQQQQPNSEHVSSGVQRSQSLRQHRSNTGSFSDVSNQGPQSPTGIGPSASGHLLTSIEEHEEAQHRAAAVTPLKLNQRKVLTKLPPNSTPASPLNQPGPQQQPFGQTVPFSASLQQTMGATGQQLRYAQAAPQMHATPQPAPILAQAAPIFQLDQIQAQAMPMQGFHPVGQSAQLPPQQYQMQQQPQPQWVPQPLPTSPLAAQPGPPPPLQMPLQTSPTAGGKENRKSWGKWFKSSGSKSAVQSPVAQQAQYTFPPVPIPQAMPGANQPFQMQPGGQQFPMGFQGGQPMGQQPLQFQQVASHPETSSHMQGTSSFHSRDVSDAASVSTMSSDLKIQSSVNQPFAQAPLNINTNSAANGSPLQQFPNDMAPAPLFSGAPSTKPIASPTEIAQQETMPASQNRWAGKSPVDYSGGGWGDEDDDEFA
ncbi:hypothetical protein ACHAQJ_004686 [Trichoderma viride]